MKYDFTTILNRHNQDAMAVDTIPYPQGTVKEGYSLIPMWVADMNYPVCPTIIEAMDVRLHQPHFGYFPLPDWYFNQIKEWHKERNNVDVEKEWIGYENGVLGCVASAIQAFTVPGEPVLFHSPTYIGFTHTMENNGRKMIFSPLKKDENGVWRMDYEDMDAKIKENSIHTVVFCSPHNPCGRVWEKEEIEKAMEVYEKNDCLVISDEIWSDIILPGYKHTPTYSINDYAKDNSVCVYAPSKTFNLAGLVGSYHIIPNKRIRDEVNRAGNQSHYNMPNVLSMYALKGAYTPEGAQWTDELTQVINDNVDIAMDFFNNKVDGIDVSRSQGTYMLYLNCSKYLKEHDMSIDELLKKGASYGVIWQDGRPFMMENTIRMNLALPTSLVKEAFDRLEKNVF
jgi:cystathionine beta-lyase